MASFGTARALIDGLFADLTSFHLKNYNFLFPLLQCFHCGRIINPELRGERMKKVHGPRLHRAAG